MFKLTLANLIRRPARTLLTVIAVALSVALVVSTTSGYASAELSVRSFIENYLGNDDFRITSGSDAAGMPSSYLRELEADPAVRSAYGRLADQRQLKGLDGVPIAKPFEVLGVDPSVDSYLSRLPIDSGDIFKSADEPSVMLDVASRRALGVDVGEPFVFPGKNGPVELKVVGVVYRPKIISILGNRSIYVPLETLQQLTRPEDPDRLTTINAALEVGRDIEQTVDRLQTEVNASGQPWKVRSTRADREVVDNGLRAMSLLALMGGMVSLLAATFIVFGTLAMGVAERQRTLAMLRGIGATRKQIATSVIGEGVLLAILGVVLGVPLGLGFVYGLTQYYEEIFTEGLAIGWFGIGAAVLGTTLAAVAASLVPAYSASRVDPLAAMRPAAEAPAKGPPWIWLTVGIGLILIDVVLLWPPLGYLPLPDDWERAGRFWLHFFIGLPTLMLGFFLIAPTLVWLADALLARPMALVMGVTPSLLKQQLGGGIWRAAGTAAALMVGPAVLIVMNTQGRSGIQGWQLPDAFPDVFMFDKNGIPADRIDEISAVEGIAKLADGTPDVTPIGYLHPRLGEGVFAIAGAAFAPDRTMFVAVDPERVFAMMDLDFTAGDLESAKRMLMRGGLAQLSDGRQVHGSVEKVAGADTLVPLVTDEQTAVPIPMDRVTSFDDANYLIVTEEFRQLRGLGPGDPFTLKRNGTGILGTLRGEDVPFVVAGVVRSPGIDLMVATFDLGRQFEGQSAASVFGTLQDARDLFGMKDVFLIAANLDVGADKKVVLERVASTLNNDGISISDVRQLKYEIQQGLGRLLTIAGVVAWAALAVSSLGVTNTVMAGVRTRRYQLGVLRAIGVTRGELLRLIVSEAILLGLAAAALGTLAGLLMALNARQLQAWTVGYVPPLQIAWDVVLVGAVAVLSVSVLASLWPAWSAAKEQVLSLLRGGRSAS